MHYKHIAPLQAWGIGDVIFTMHLAKSFGKPIKWGVETHFISGLKDAYPDVEWVDSKTIGLDYSRKDDYVINDIRVLPIRWAEQILKVPYVDCMRAKYDMYGLDWNDWRNTKPLIPAGYIHVPNEEYILMNRHFGSNSQYKAGFDIKSSIKVIEMRSLPGKSLFDWIPIIQNATRIYTVSTSILYILELFDLKADEVHLFDRKPIEPGFQNVDYLFKKKYILH